MLFIYVSVITVASLYNGPYDVNVQRSLHKSMQRNKFVISNWAASALTKVYTLIRRSTLTSSQMQKCITIIPMWAFLENFP